MHPAALSLPIPYRAADHHVKETKSLQAPRPVPEAFSSSLCTPQAPFTFLLFFPVAIADPIEPLVTGASAHYYANRLPIPTSTQHHHNPSITLSTAPRQSHNHHTCASPWLNSSAPRFLARPSRSQAGPAIPHIAMMGGTDFSKVHRPAARGHGSFWSRLVCLHAMQPSTHTNERAARPRTSLPARPWPSRRS